MTHLADVTLGAIVFGFGVTYQYFINTENRSDIPSLRVLAVTMWALLAYVLWYMIGHVQKTNPDITIHAALILCISVMGAGSALGYALSKFGGTWAAWRGHRIYQAVMRQKEGANEQRRRWQ